MSPLKTGSGIIHLFQTLSLDLPEPIANIAQKPEIMTDQQTGCIVIDQLYLERNLPIDIEMVCRLVQ